MTGVFGEPNLPAEQARFVILPVPYERTTTYRRGTAGGPTALLAASTQVELFDEETGVSPLKAGIALLASVFEPGMPDQLAEKTEALVRAHLEAGRVVGCLGGEHSVTLGPARAAVRTRPGLGLLQIDAHPDLRDSYQGTRYGHGCVMRRLLEEPGLKRLVQVGLRAVSDEDRAAMHEEDRIRPFYAFDLHRRAAGEWTREILDALPERVYLSVDLDGLDPSVVPGTGTPEPGGLGWWETLGLLRAVAKERTIVAFDIVELLPEAHSKVSDFAAAKLLFKLLAYLVAGA